MSEIINIKMVNGEEIVAKIKGEDDDTVTVEKPAMIMLQPNGTGGVQVQMGPWTMFSDKPISINKKAIMYIAEPNTELLNSYNANFGSGIVVPPKGLITG